MTFDTSKAYTIQDKTEANTIELQSIRQVENWFQAKIKSQQLTDGLKSQFDEIELSIKERDFKTVQRLESQILSHHLQIKELGQKLSEIQMGKKNMIYFKVVEA